ncbi:DUF4258 domain-containing protein [Candidatus Magnetomoraceae bacterium gMMP-13]
MQIEDNLPDDPLAFIRRCVKQRKIFWTYHINMRLTERYISRKAIISSVPYYEIIEEYQDDKYFPSYLIYSRYQDQIFHVLFGVDVVGDNVRIITAYYPHLQKWETDLKTRRQKR